MWFNNALVFDLTFKDPVDVNALLAEHRLKACPPHTRFSYGWVPPFPDGELAHDVAGCILVCLGKEERILPKSVIKQIANERAREKELQDNRQLKKSEIAKMVEDVEFELLPKAFCAQKRWTALIDTKDNRLIVNTSSISQADQVTAMLRKAIPGLTIDPWFSEMNLCQKFSHFITQPATIPEGFTLASDCHLISPDDEKKKIQCKGYELPADEVLSLLEQGLHPTELSLIWQDRLQFTFTNQLVLKRIKCMDYLIDEFSEIGKMDEQIEQQDAALTLLSGELRGLVTALNANV